MNQKQYRELIDIVKNYDITILQALKVNEAIEYNQYFKLNTKNDFINPEIELLSFNITKRYISLYHKKVKQDENY